ncbi:hypothetical protein Tco_0714266 [Tanacetum coccineum]
MLQKLSMEVSTIRSLVEFLKGMVKGIVVTRVNVSVFGTSVSFVLCYVPKFLSGKRESDKDRDMERLGGFGSLGFEESDVVLVRVAMVFDNVGLFEFMSIVMPIFGCVDLACVVVEG